MATSFATDEPSSNFDIWFQVPMGSDQPSPLFDLNSTFQFLALNKDKSAGIETKQESPEVDPESPGQTDEDCMDNTCKDCGTSELNSEVAYYMHMHLIHNQFVCLICNASFINALDLADHLKILHEVKEKPLHSTQEQFSLPQNKRFFVCTECSAVVHYLDLLSHGLDCNAIPLFPVQENTDVKDEEWEASEALSLKLRTEEMKTLQQIFSLQSSLEWMKNMLRKLEARNLELRNSKEYKQHKTMKHLIGKLTATKHHLMNSAQESKQDPRGLYTGQEKHLEKVCIQLKAVQKSYAKTEKDTQKLSKQFEMLKAQMQFLEIEKKKKTLDLLNMKEKMAKIRLHREIEDLGRERAQICSQPILHYQQ